MRNKFLRRGRALAILASAALALLSPALRAQTIRPDPDSGEGEGYVDYVGRYGELFKLPGAWQIVPFRSRGTEVINLYPKFDRRAPDYSLTPFKPKPSDFKPENFTPLGLIQLMIVPHSSEAGRSLEDLKKAKLADLKASGVTYEVIDDPFFPPARGGWPKGTFEIKVTEPYLLTQLYTATPLYTCILTAGIDTPPSTYIGRHYDDLRYGLAAWVVPQEPPVHEQTPAETIAAGVSLHPFVVPIVWVSWAAATGLALLLMLLGAKTRWDLLRRVGRSFVVFSNAGAVLGGLIGLLFWPFAWFTHHSPLLTAIACLFQPLVALAVGRARGSAPHRRALIGAALWTLVAATFMVYCGVFDWGVGIGGDKSRYVFAISAINGFLAFAVGGIVFGVLDSAPKGSTGGHVFALLLALVLPAQVQAQATSQAALEAARTAALSRLRARHTTKDSFRQTAIDHLAQQDSYYDYQRVEIRGIFSEDTADNDTNSNVGPIFDKQISPTHLGKDTVPAEFPLWFKEAVRGSEYAEDLASLKKEARNEITSAAENAVQELHGKEVNEIVAHSWGTEIVYNAILTHKINPPRRLLVFGMPDKDLEKWKALSKYTGTEVIVYPNENDPMAGAARVGQTVNEDAAHIGRVLNMGAAAAQMGPLGEGKIGEKVIELAHRGPDSAEFERQWQAACAKTECNPHNRRPPEVVYRPEYQGDSHDRFEYYDAAQRAHDLPMPPLDEVLTKPYTDNAFSAFPGSIKALKAEQKARIDNEERVLYGEAVAAETAGALQPAEGAKTDGDASFYDSAAKLAPLLAKARDAFPAQEAAATAEWQKSPEYLAYRAHMIALEEEARARDAAAQQARYETYVAEERRRQEHYADMKNRWEYLRTMTGLACSDPDALEKLGRDGRVPGVVIGDLDLEWEMSRNEGADQKFRPVVNSCQKYVLTALQNSSSLVHGRDMLAWARHYRDLHPSLLTRFTAGVADMFRAMGSVFDDDGGSSDGDDGRSERAVARSGSGQTDADREQWKRSWEAQTREGQKMADIVHEAMSRHSPDNWSSLNQLRGIASH